MTRLYLPLTLCLASACGGGTNGGDSPDAGDDVVINKDPTGSIQTPSLCERTGTDQKVLDEEVSGFDFLWVGDHYQLVYADAGTHDIYSVQLTKKGKTMGSAQVVEATESASDLPSLVKTDSGFVVAWQEAGDTPGVRVHALDSNGAPAGASQQIATTRSSQVRPVLARTAAGIVVGWMDQDQSSASDFTDVGDSHTWLAALDDSLAPRTEPAPRQIGDGTHSGYPSLASSGDTLALLWSDGGSGRTDTMLGVVGNDLTVSGKDVRGPDASAAALLGRLEPTGFGYLATWEDHRSGQAEIYMSLLDATGTRTGGGLVEEPNTGNANWSHQAWMGSAAGVVYYQFRSGRPQIFMTFIDDQGARVGGAADSQISNTTAQALFPDVRWDGSAFGVLWVDSRDGGQGRLYFNSATCQVPAPI